jgi:hypothetical protein
MISEFIDRLPQPLEIWVCESKYRLARKLQKIAQWMMAL